MEILSAQEASVIAQMYEDGEPLYKLAKHFKIPYRQVLRALAAQGVQLRSPSEQKRTEFPFNEAAFDILTPEAAYWVGFLMADGYLDNRTRRVSIGLSEVDYAHIEKWKRFLDAPHRIDVRPPNPNGFSGGRGRVSLSVASRRLAAKLKEYGMKLNPRKAATPELIASPDFWRGVIDGDGSIIIDKRNNAPRISIVGCKELLEQFLEFTKIYHPDCASMVLPHKSIFHVQISRRSEVMSLLNLLYANCAIALDRKHAKALAILADPSYGKLWGLTPKERDEIVARYIAGENSIQLAAAFGANKNTITSILKKHRITARGRHKLTSNALEEIERRYLAGESSVALGAAYGVTKSTIAVALKKRGLRMRGNRN